MRRFRGFGLNSKILNFKDYVRSSGDLGPSHRSDWDQKVHLHSIEKNGRAGGIRTRDPLVPNQVRYQLRYGSIF